MAIATIWTATVVVMGVSSSSSVAVLDETDLEVGARLVEALSQRLSDLDARIVLGGEAEGAWIVRARDNDGHLGIELINPRGELEREWTRVGDESTDHADTIRLAALLLDGRIRRSMSAEPEPEPEPTPKPSLPTDQLATLDAYDEYRRMRVQPTAADWVDEGQELEEWSDLTTGRYDKPMSWADFYRAAGRADLADELELNQNLILGAAWTAYAVVLGSAALMLVGLGKLTSESPNAGWLTLGGLIGTQVGIGVILLCRYADPQPIEPAEGRELIDDYNRKLRARLGLQAERERALTAGISLSF